MMKWTGGKDEDQLRHILKKYDPELPIGGPALAALEENILSRIDGLERERLPLNPSYLPGFCQQAWSARIAALSALIILMAGFIFGQVFYSSEDTATFAGTLSLVAFADEASGQFLPVSDTSWGVNDDNAE